MFEGEVSKLERVEGVGSGKGSSGVGFIWNLKGLNIFFNMFEELKGECWDLSVLEKM